VRRLRIFGQRDKLKADRSKGGMRGGRKEQAAQRRIQGASAMANPIAAQLADALENSRPAIARSNQLPRRAIGRSGCCWRAGVLGGGGRQFAGVSRGAIAREFPGLRPPGGKFTRKACGYVDDRRCRPAALPPASRALVPAGTTAFAIRGAFDTPLRPLWPLALCFAPLEGGCGDGPCFLMSR
jgi:hypothetical protein